MDIEQLKENLELRPFFINYVRANMTLSISLSLEYSLSMSVDSKTLVKMVNRASETLGALIQELEKYEQSADSKEIQYVFEKLCEYYLEKIRKGVF